MYPSKHKTFVVHLYNVGPMSKRLGRRCTNVTVNYKRPESLHIARHYFDLERRTDYVPAVTKDYSQCADKTGTVCKEKMKKC